jgi:ABC-type Fe3+/spermidine/putrescine transport system ATPase subunit
MSDEIIVMSKGRIQQRGGPREIYGRPVNAYVSNFIGAANLLKGHVLSVTAPGRGEVEIAAGSRKAQVSCRLGAGIAAGADAVISVRPENVEATRQNGGGPSLEGEVIQAIFLGNCVDCRVRWGEFEWKVMAHPRSGLKAGEKVYLRLDPEHTLAVQP